MAQQLTEIFTGMPRGPEAIQDDLQKLNLADAVYHDWSDEGLVLLNGAQKYFSEKNTFGYQYIQFQGFKVIDLRAELKINISALKEVVQLPASICPDGSIQRTGKANGAGFFNFSINDYSDSKKITILKPATNASWYSINAIYVRKDD